MATHAALLTSSVPAKQNTTNFQNIETGLEKLNVNAKVRRIYAEYIFNVLGSLFNIKKHVTHHSFFNFSGTLKKNRCV